MSDSVFQLHKHPHVIRVGQRAGGQLLIWAVATALLWSHNLTVLLPITVACVMWRPDYRRIIVSLAAAATIGKYFVERADVSVSTLPADIGAWLKPAVLIVGVLIGLYFIYWLCMRFAAWPKIMQRYPVVTLHAGFWFGMALVGLFPALSLITELGAWLIWRISYFVQFASRGRATNTRFSDHLMYLWPVFGGNQPFGKGYEYLSRHEVKDSAAFTVSQLSGIKLLVMAMVWQWALLLLDVLLLGGDIKNLPTALAVITPTVPFAVPPIGEAISTGNVGVGAAWASIYVELVRITLVIAVRGHIVVGCLRLLGFNVFRNTYKPLLSESILEFWSRFNYYFKELLVDFFFYPTFLRSTWAGPRLRLFLAVFAAAFLGNMYFHSLLYPSLLIEGDLTALWKHWNSRMVYCFCLAVGVWVSMLRQQKQRRESTSRSWPVRLRAIAGVLTFYAIIHVWNVDVPDGTIGDRVTFCLRLVGISV